MYKIPPGGGGGGSIASSRPIKKYKSEFMSYCYHYQSSHKRRITRIGTYVFSLGHMIFARRESCVRMFFKSAHAKNPVAERYIHTGRSKAL